MKPEVGAIIKRLSELALDPKDPRYSVEHVAEVLDELFIVLGSENITGVIEHAVRTGTLSLAEGALVLGVGQWSGNEGGRSQVATLYRWLLDADDVVRVGLALQQDWFPFATASEMIKRLAIVERKFPQFLPRCRAMVAARAGRD